MIDKHNINEDRTLKDFNTIVHIVSVPLGSVVYVYGEEHPLHSLYLNKYGVTIGALISHPNGQISSWDPNIWEEAMETPKFKMYTKKITII